VAAFFIMLAMVIYVTTGDLSFRPGSARRAPVPILAPSGP
jgi:hypothetical protein